MGWEAFWKSCSVRALSCRLEPKRKPEMSQKKCLYELLGLSKNCSQEEIRYAYKKLALQLHPDKLIQTGIPEDQATAGFQELINAYEVLSDPRERAWYDSHREQILFASSDSSNVSGTPSDFIRTQNIWSYFSNSVYSGYDDSGKGFFKVYGDVFAKLFDLEVAFAKKIGLDRSAVKESPLMGNLESHYSQVSAFYGYWLGFATVMDFSWVDQYHASEGPNRKARRVMEEENKKLRKKARREYNEMVRGLAEFVRKRDKRVIDWQLQKNLEKKKKEEAEILRRKEEKRARLEKAMLYEEPNWAITNEIVDESDDQDELEKEAGGVKNRDGKELYCIVCSKKFKSEKQWKNHEQSKKHRDKLAELRDVHMDDEEILEDDRGETHVGTDELCSEIEETPDFQEEETNAGCGSNWGVDDPGDFRSSSGDEEEIVITDVKGEENSSDFSCIHEETDILEAMIDHNTTKDAVVHEPDSSPSIVCSPHSETPSFMKSNARKNNPRNRESKKESGTSCNAGSGSCSNGSKDAEDVKVDLNGSCDDGDSAKPNDGVGVSHMQETDVNLDDLSPERKQKPVNQPFDKKASGQNEANAKRKISSKGKKQKGTSKISGHLCETCGESFDSRNKLFGHLSGTGHAVLKSR